MSLWNDHVFPRVMDRVLRTPEVNARRAKVCQGLHGRVLEVGFGTGLNLRHYPTEVTEILVVEPSKSAMWLAEPRNAAVTVNVTHVGIDGAHLDLPDGSVDCVLSTYTLCTIASVMRRCWRFVECSSQMVRCISSSMGGHRLSRSAAGSVGCSRIAGGCHLDRPIDDLITRAGLIIRALETGYGDGPRPFSYLYRGRALQGP